MKLRHLLATAAGLALPAFAHAQPVTGPYVSIEGGTSILNPTNYDYENYDNTGRFQFRPDYAGAVSLGYGIGDGFRVEVEGNIYRNTIRRDDNNGFGGFQAHGAQFTYGGFLNVLYDVNVGLPIFPYIGAGAGYEWAKFQPHIDDTQSFEDTIEGTHGSFAYQLIAGLSYPLPFYPQLALTVDYRFMQRLSSRNYDSTYLAQFGGTNGFDGNVKIGQQSSHTVMGGIRYALFPPAPPPPAPAPAPVAAPAPAPAKTYLVFFDWDKYNLTPRATQIIAEAASDSRSQNTTVINVSGYTDTSGTAQYNMGLSERRARAVAAQLVTDGVPQSEISIHAYGETHLLVPTGPGVREPQNRRVEIVLQ